MRQARYWIPYPVAGVNLTPDEALSIATVWACIDVIARAIASCDWNIYQPNGAFKNTLLHADPMMWNLNTQPNPEMTAIGFREALLFQAIPLGNAYAEIVRDMGGRVAELWPLPSDRVTPKRDPDWKLYYEYRQPDGTLTMLEPRQVFHLRGPGLYGLMGENVVARAAKSLGVAAAQERYSAAFFGQGASPSGVLEYPGMLGDVQYKRLKEDWIEKKKGPENAHKPMILEHGMKWTATSVDPQKSMLIEGKQFSVEEICRWFGVPPHKIQHLLHATFSNIEHSSIEFVRDALQPWACRLEQEGDIKFFRQDRAPWKKTKINLKPLTQGDAKSRADANAINRQNGIMTANEIRATEGLDDIGPEGDVLLVQSNLTTVERLMNPPEPPAPALPPGGDGSSEGGEPAPADPPASAVARQALEVFMGLAAERYSKRMAAAKADRAKRAEGAELERQLAIEQREAMNRVVADLVPALPFAFVALGRAVEQSELQQAVERVIAGELSIAAAATCLRAG